MSSEMMVGQIDAFNQGYKKGLEENCIILETKMSEHAKEIMRLIPKLSHLELYTLRHAMLNRELEMEKEMMEEVETNELA